MRAIHGVMAKRRACHSAGTVAEAKKRKRQLVTKLRQRVDEAANVIAELGQQPDLLLSKKMFAPLLPHLKTVFSSNFTFWSQSCGPSVTNNEACGGKAPHQFRRSADGQPQLVPSVVTRGFIKQLCPHQTSKPANPVLLVCGSERRKKMSSSLAAGGKFQSQMRLVLTDGDNSMAAGLATQFAKQGEGICEPGSILRISKYTCVGCSPGNDDDVMLALLIHKAEFVTSVAMTLSKYPRGMRVDNEKYFSASLQRSEAGDGSITGTPRSSDEAAAPQSSAQAIVSQAGDGTTTVEAQSLTSTNSTITEAAWGIIV